MNPALPLLSTVALVAVAGAGRAAAGPTASPPIYRCMQAGVQVFSDRPCGERARQAALPALQRLPAQPGAPDLAAQWDRRQAARTAQRNRRDQAWLKAHAARHERETRVRRGLVEGRVVIDMTPEQVRRVLGEPRRVTRARAGVERWIYAPDRTHHTTVGFRDGRVSSVRGTAADD